MTRDERFMGIALEAAHQNLWSTHPNPMVGAVIVRDDEVIATGTHLSVGHDHAETAALRALPDPELARGAEMFVTLEPCNHFAHTPPCTNALIEAGLRRVVVATVDPDPRVSGAGIDTLRNAGIDVLVGVLETECRALNRPFFKRVTHDLPWVTLKMATTLDGKIATENGDSQWITSPEARAEVHRMRASHDAILVGTGTLVADDPALTVRLAETTASPTLRVVLDRTFRAGRERAVYAPQSDAPTLLFTSHDAEARARESLEPAVDVVGVPVHGNRLDLRAALTHLAVERRITTLLCEGGGELAASLLADDLVDEYHAFVAAKLCGGREAPGPIGGMSAPTMNDAITLELDRVDRIGPDLRIVAHRPRSESSDSAKRR